MNARVIVYHFICMVRVSACSHDVGHEALVAAMASQCTDKQHIKLHSQIRGEWKWCAKGEMGCAAAHSSSLGALN
jgi:hypothetical protein